MILTRFISRTSFFFVQFHLQKWKKSFPMKFEWEITNRDCKLKCDPEFALKELLLTCVVLSRPLRVFSKKKSSLGLGKEQVFLLSKE